MLPVRCITLVLAAVFALSCAPSDSVRFLLLHDGWEFRRLGDDTWRPAIVPGTVHTDLLANEVIGDPFWRDNESSVQWIESDDWHYRTVFRLTPEMQRAEHLDLVFEGLDTYAEVRLNDVEILRADNMFRRWEVDVREVVRQGDNRLDVIFRSPLNAALTAREAQGYGLPVHNEPTRPFTRKAAYHYGWDWGPRLVTAGIWRPVRVRAWNGLLISDVHVMQRSLTDELAVLTVMAEVRSDGIEQVSIDVTSPDDAFQPAGLRTGLEPGVDTVAIDLEIPNPQRWWPNGLGKQPLYEMVVSVSSPGVVDRARRRVGLRTVAVITEPDSIGESFRIEVNDVPVFMKGANYVPADHFTTRVDESRHRELLEAATSAHMNMLRVWGGGVYPDDAFYDLADELGILIWQDFMFANAMVPSGESFLRNVAAEARDQVRRLRNHPSLALWCGNNEIDEAWHNWGWANRYPADEAAEIWSAYEQVFHRVLPDTVVEEDPGRFYWPSSPRLGWGRVESLNRGDSHYWGVWHGREPFETYKQKLPRFASEFGFQAYPALETVEAFTEPDDRHLHTPVLTMHQKHATGLETVREYMARWYREPRDFPSFLYVSQLLQAEGMGMAFEAQRRAMPRTMGTLYWQLNDSWPVASWSSLDYYGRWKALHYVARAAFAPVLVSPIERDGSLEVHLVSDRLEPSSGRLELQLLDFGGRELWTADLDVRIQANSSALVFAVPVTTVLDGADRGRVVLRARLLEGDTTIADKLHYFARPKDLELTMAKLSVKFERDGDEGLVRISSNALAKNVYLTLPGTKAFFDDNFFDLLPGREKLVRVALGGAVIEPGARVEVRTLIDTY